MSRSSIYVEPDELLHVPKLGDMDITFTDKGHAALSSGQSYGRTPGLTYRGNLHHVSIHVYTPDCGQTWLLGEKRIPLDQIDAKRWEVSREVYACRHVGEDASNAGKAAIAKAVLAACQEQLSTGPMLRLLLLAEVKSCERQKEKAAEELKAAAEAHSAAGKADLDARLALGKARAELAQLDTLKEAAEAHP